MRECVCVCIQFMIKCIFMYSPVANKIYTIHDVKVGYIIVVM